MQRKGVASCHGMRRQISTAASRWGRDITSLKVWNTAVHRPPWLTVP